MELYGCKFIWQRMHTVISNVLITSQLILHVIVVCILSKYMIFPWISKNLIILITTGLGGAHINIGQRPQLLVLGCLLSSLYFAASCFFSPFDICLSLLRTSWQKYFNFSWHCLMFFFGPTTQFPASVNK